MSIFGVTCNFYWLACCCSLAKASSAATRLSVSEGIEVPVLNRGCAEMVELLIFSVEAERCV